MPIDEDKHDSNEGMDRREVLYRMSVLEKRIEKLTLSDVNDSVEETQRKSRESARGQQMEDPTVLTKCFVSDAFRIWQVAPLLTPPLLW